MISIAQMKQCIAAGMTARQIRDQYDQKWKYKGESDDESRWTNSVASVQDAMDLVSEVEG